VIVDYVATFMAGALYFMLSFGSEPFEKGEIPQETMEKFLSDPENLLVLGLLGTLCTVLGGYVAGRMAKDLEVKHGALVGAGSLILGAVEQVLVGEPSSFAPWYLVLGYAVAIPAGMLGGYLARRRREFFATFLRDEDNEETMRMAGRE
jgi:putative membrane protein (TIGR04086 family)